MGTSYLVTGATGYIGGWLCARLCKEGHEVHAIVRESSSTRSIVDLGVQTHVHEGSTANLIAIVDRTKPDVVFHLASNFLAQHTVDDVAGLVSSNVTFGAQLLEAMRAGGAASLINTGTAWQHFGGMPYAPVNLYAATKQAFLDVARFYHEAYGIGVITLELPDTYGPADTRRKLFRVLREAQASGRPLGMSGGEQMLDLVHIDDAIEAFVLAGRLIQEDLRGSFASYQVSSRSARPLREVVELYAAISGESIDVDWGRLPYRPREMMTPWSGGECLPGWQAKVVLEQGLRRLLQPTSGQS